MSTILGIETSTKICSVALTVNNKLVAIKEEGGEYSHAEKLNGFIENVIEEANLSLRQIDAVAISKGPGSYTGLRIGVSTAKGLCYSLNKPLIAVDTLQAMALSMINDDVDVYCPMIDARRMEVYTALYDKNNESIQSVTAKVIDEHSYEETFQKGKILFFGDGSDKCKEVLGSSDNAIFSSEGLPSASNINRIAAAKYENSEFEDIAYFEPYYLKDFIATKAKKLL